MLPRNHMHQRHLMLEQHWLPYRFDPLTVGGLQIARQATGSRS